MLEQMVKNVPVQHHGPTEGKINLSLSWSIGGGAEKNGEGAKKQKFCRKTKENDVEKRKNRERGVKLMSVGKFSPNCMHLTMVNLF